MKGVIRMSEQINVILAPMAGRTVCTTKTVYQYNQGMILRLLGIDLPQAYTVDFANSVTGRSISQVGGESGVTIPDQFFVPGSTIHAWVVLSGTGYSVTRYHIMIPISPRAMRTNETPTPSQQSALDEAIAALNQALEEAEHLAAVSGYMEFHMDERGHVIYTRTDATDVDFRIDADAGHLILEVV